MRNIIKLFSSRIIIIGFLIILQLAVILFGIVFLASKAFYMNAAFTTFSVILAIYILNKPENPSYKLAWIIPLLLFPILGGPLYFLMGGHKIGKHLRKEVLNGELETQGLLNQDPEIMNELKALDFSFYNQCVYLGTEHKSSYKGVDIDSTVFPVYRNTSSEFLSPGEAFFDTLLDELNKAEHFIFMEYFIIEEGHMWDSILEVLHRKASEGVDVRLIYDDFGCIMKLPKNYHNKLNDMGIKCKVFNPLNAHAFNIASMNNRDHRKITVIDGHTGFTGGINLADEYINVTHPFGHWKDSAVMLKGDAVWSLTVMFMKMWNYCGTRVRFDYEQYRPHVYRTLPFENDGYVLPYSDSPVDWEMQAEMVYMNIINKADRYIYITTPYLIVDNELMTSLSLAAKNGVDVRIVTPRQYDKWYVHFCTQAHYYELIRAGVKIYEYTPGFIHAKTFVSDDETATIGTVNMDFRSLYLHFECGTLLYKTKAVMQLKEDYLKMLDECELITEDFCNNTNIFKRIFRGLFKVFSPLL